MSKLHFIKAHLNNKTVVHLAMLAFAVTSSLNVASFFVATHHHVVVASTIGLALGAGLMAVSIYLSNQDTSNRVNFLMLLAAAICMALLSGQIQTMNYRLHGLDTLTAVLLGYAPPFTIEILLALSVSLAERNERERVQRDSKSHIKNSVASTMADAFKDIDTARIQRHIDKQVDGVVRAFVDDALSEMLNDLGSTTGNDEPAKPTEKRQIADYSPESLPVANEKRQQLATERQQAIATLLAGYGPLSTSELRQRLAEDRGITASDRTIRADCNKLVETGEVAKDGRKWAVVASIAETLPSVGEPVLNGHHG